MDLTGPLVLDLWRRAGRLPGGRGLLSWLIGKLVPYTGSISPRILELEEGRAVVTMEDRRRVRNHLRSIHALALANLAELAGSLALVTRVPSDRRWIVTGLEVDFLRKARGRVTGTCDVRELDLPEDGEACAEVELRDEAGEVLVRARIRLRIGPRPEAGGASSPGPG